MLNNLTNFPLEAQLQLILSRIFSQYFKMSYYNHSYYVIPYVPMFQPLMFSNARKLSVSFELSQALVM